MKVLEINPSLPNKVAIREMRDHQVGRTEQGSIYIRYGENAHCVTNPGQSYTGNACYAKEIVEIIPPGTKIIFEV